MVASPTSIQMSNTAKQKIVDEALSWVGTPYHAQAQLKGIGVDCAQLIAGIAKGAGIDTDMVIPFNYNAQHAINSDDEEMLRLIESYGCTQTETPEPGDIVAFKMGRSHGHLGILVSETDFVHAEYQRTSKGTTNGSVVQVPLNGDWLQRGKLYYELPKGI